MLAASVLIGACGASGPTPEAVVGVHVVNRISNVVLTKTGGLIGFAPGSDSEQDFGSVAPCGGEVELSVPVGEPGGFDLVLYLDPSGALDRLYAEGTALDPVSLQSIEPSIMFSSSDLREGQYLTITPDDVLVTDAASAPQATGGTCQPWSTPPS